jgi:chaperonin GroES
VLNDGGGSQPGRLPFRAKHESGPAVAPTQIREGLNKFCSVSQRYGCGKLHAESTRFDACSRKPRRRSIAMATATATATQTFTPLHDRILVRRVEEADTVRGGIIIPDTAKEKPQEGEVISVGKGKSNDEGKVFPLDVKKGDRILFGKYSGTEIKIDGEEFLIMREEEVLGILKK